MKGILVRVKVLGQKDGQPIAGAQVRLVWTDTDRDRYTDANGEVELPALTAQTLHLEASAKDHAAVTRILNLANGPPAPLESRRQATDLTAWDRRRAGATREHWIVAC